MQLEEIRKQFGPAIDEIVDGCMLTDEFVDKDRFRIYMATVWGNAVVNPQNTGIAETDLELLHDFLNEEIARVLGDGQSLRLCYEYLLSKAGEESLIRLQVGQQHIDFIRHIGQLILGQDPLSAFENSSQ